jgi:hypothetical protein
MVVSIFPPLVLFTLFDRNSSQIQFIGNFLGIVSWVFPEPLTIFGEKLGIRVSMRLLAPV